MKGFACLTVATIALAAFGAVYVSGEFAAPNRQEAYWWLEFLAKMGPHPQCFVDPHGAQQSEANAFAFARWNADATIYHGTIDNTWVGGNINAGSFYAISPIYATFHPTNEHYTTHGSGQLGDYHITALPHPAVRRYTFTATANAAAPDIIYAPALTMQYMVRTANRHDATHNAGHLVLPAVALSLADQAKSENVQAAKVLTGRLAGRGIRGIIQRRQLLPADVKSVATTYLAKRANHVGALNAGHYAGFSKAAPYNEAKLTPFFPGGNKFLAYDELIATGQPAFVADDAINTASADPAINGLNAWADACTANTMGTSYGVDYMSVVPFSPFDMDTDRTDARSFEVFSSLQTRGLAATLTDLHALNSKLMALALKVCVGESLDRTVVIDQSDAAGVIAGLASKSKTQSLTTQELAQLRAAAGLLYTHCKLTKPTAFAPPAPEQHRARARLMKAGHRQRVLTNANANANAGHRRA